MICGVLTMRHQVQARLIPILGCLLAVGATTPLLIAQPYAYFPFIENDGQWPESARFVRRFSGCTAVVESDAIGLELATCRSSNPCSTASVRLRFEGANPTVTPVGLDEVPAAFNFFIGANRARWRSGVRGYDRLLFDDLYPGVDMLLRSRNDDLEYDLLLSPGARLDEISVSCEGALAVSIDSDGALVIDTPLGAVRQPTPTTWEIAPDGLSQVLPCHYRMTGPHAFGFTVEGWTGGTPLVIDPGLEWSTYLGSAAFERVGGIAIADNGDVLVAGNTHSSDFPTSSGSFDPTCDATFGCSDGFISRLSADGTSLINSTFIGGLLTDEIVAVAIDSAGHVSLVGWTTSSDFPVTPGALDTGGGLAVFVARLSADGSSLLASARFGGSVLDFPKGGILEASGNVIVFGYTDSSDFPTTPGALDHTKALNSDGFLARISSDGSQLLYGSFLGGDGPDQINAAALEPSGRLLLAVGVGGSSGFPSATPGAFNTVINSIYLARLSPDCSTIEAATFLGGLSGDLSRALATRPDGSVVIAGWTYSPDFPVTPGAVQDTAPSTLATNGFLTCFDSSLSSLVYSTYLGGGPTAEVTALHVDVAGQITVAGRTDGGGFPVTLGAFDVHPDAVDCFVTRFSPDGRRLFYSTFLGGSLAETIGFSSVVASLAVTPDGSAIIGTQSDSVDYPVTAGVVQTTLAGDFDAVVTRLDMLPQGVNKFGTSTPGCLGPLAAGVTSMPHVGSADFAVTCTATPPGSAQGLLALSMASLQASVTAVGAQLWLDPTQLFALVPAQSVGLGFSIVPLRIPASAMAVGLGVFGQFFWRDLCGPAGWSASNALHVVVQP